MTLRYSTNIVTTGGNDILFRWKEFMKTAPPNGPGWTVTLSSDGTTFGAGDNIASAATWGNNGWYVLRDPASAREICVKKDSSDTSFEFVYSISAHFSGGGATTRPTASDEQLILSNSGPTTWTNTRPAIYHFMANDQDGYGFYMVGYGYGDGMTGNGIGSLVMEEMEPTSANVDGYANDAVVFIVGTASTLNFTPSNMNNESASTFSARNVCWHYYGHASAAWVTMPALTFGTANTVFQVVPQSAIIDRSIATSGKVITFPIPYARRAALAAPNGWKGIGRFVKWVGSPISTGFVITGTDSNRYLVVNNCGFIWNGDTPLS
jgi:hypothetical protein